MAKKPKAATPADPNPTPPTEPTSGFPQHGDPAPSDGDELDLEDEGGEEDLEEQNEETAEQKVARLEAEMADLRRRIPPSEPKQPTMTKTPEEEEEPDWDKLLYDNPKEAMRLHGERVATRVKKELTTQYQREKGQETFWNNFYDKNKDLKPDHDLVETTLKANLNDLANIPVEDAMKKLADLTRDRILRYAGGKPKGGGKKAVAEGAAPPSPPKATPEPEAPSSLSDIIKARARKRRGQVAA